MLTFNRKTIGIFGGSFDPPHKGHVEISKIILKKINYQQYIRNKDIVIITNKTVAKLHLTKVKNVLKKFRVETYIIPDGERFKNTDTLNKIHNFLIEKNFDRQLTIIAFGGGVIGDLAGFAAGTFLRGVDFFWPLKNLFSPMLFVSIILLVIFFISGHFSLMVLTVEFS